MFEKTISGNARNSGCSLVNCNDETVESHSVRAAKIRYHTERKGSLSGPLKPQLHGWSYHRQ